MAIKWRDYSYIYHTVGGHEVTFEISDEDTSGDVQYFGYLSETGSWIIQQRTAATGAYRYAMGQNKYKTGTTGAWATRATTMVYTYFKEMVATVL